MEVTITERPKLKRASAVLRHGCIHVKLPRHWPKGLKNQVTLELVEKVLADDRRTEKLLASPSAQGPRITLSSVDDLRRFVERVNTETFTIPLGKVRMGHSRYTQLAQLNLRTKVMTVSRFCLKDVPLAALRYLIVHELAHYLEASHNKRFWHLVGRHVPDYRLQSRIIKAFHRRAVRAAEQDEVKQGETDWKTLAPPTPKPPKAPKRSAGPLNALQQLSLFGNTLFPKLFPAPPGI